MILCQPRATSRACDGCGMMIADLTHNLWEHQVPRWEALANCRACLAVIDFNANRLKARPYKMPMKRPKL